MSRLPLGLIDYTLTFENRPQPQSDLALKGLMVKTET
jgi:hypothetical protein